MRSCAPYIFHTKKNWVVYIFVRCQCDKNENMLAWHLVFTSIHQFLYILFFFGFLFCFSHKCTHIHSSYAFDSSYQTLVETISLYSAHIIVYMPRFVFHIASNSFFWLVHSVYSFGDSFPLTYHT